MRIFNPLRSIWRKTLTHLGHVRTLSMPYFRSEERWSARFLLLAIIGLNLGMVYVLVLLNDWNRVFYDALQNHDEVVFWEQLKVFGMLAGAFIVVAVYRFYLTQLLEIRWRAWMTKDFLKASWNHAKDLHGIGQYASTAWEIFCRGTICENEPQDGALKVYWKWYKKNYENQESGNCQKIFQIKNRLTKAA